MQTLDLSAVDEARFGVRTAKAHVDDPAVLDELLSRCRSLSVPLLILRIPVAARAAVAAAERAGALLMDVLCYYEHPLPVHGTATFPGAVGFRLANPSDAHLVERLARVAFKDYPSHYHNDHNLSRLDVAEVYPAWAKSCCERTTAQEPLVLLQEAARPIGFAALRKVVADELDVALLAIAPAARGRNGAAALLHQLLVLATDLGAQRLTYSTQITNLAMQRVLARAGFVPTHSDYTFHFWSEFGRS